MSDLVPMEERVGAILDKLREALFSKGVTSLGGLARTFKLADNSGNKRLDSEELEEALTYYGLFLKAEELTMLFRYCDSDSSGEISYDEFISALAPPLTARRKSLVDKVFQKLDSDGSGVITPGEVGEFYDVSKHPAVMKGEKTTEEVLADFLNGFDGSRGNNDGRVTMEEWERYYRDMSATIPSDEYFVSMMQNVWKVSEDGVTPPNQKKLQKNIKILRNKLAERASSRKNERRVMKDMFHKFAADDHNDKNPALSPKEFRQAMDHFGLPLNNADLKTFFSEFDKDGSGCINYEEFKSHIFPKGK